MYVGAFKAAKERYLSVAYLMGSYRRRYGALLEDPENNYARGNNAWPTTLKGAHHLLIT